MAISGSYLVAAEAEQGVVVYDAADVGALHGVGKLVLSTPARALCLSGSLLYVATDDGLSVVEFADPLAPVVVGQLSGFMYGNGQGCDVVYSSGRAFTCDGFNVYSVDVSESTHPVLSGSGGSTGGYALGLAVAGRRLFVAGFGGYQQPTVWLVDSVGLLSFEQELQVGSGSRALCLSDSVIFGCSTYEMFALDTRSSDTVEILSSTTVREEDYPWQGLDGQAICSDSQFVYVGGAASDFYSARLCQFAVRDVRHPVMRAFCELPSGATCVAIDEDQRNLFVGLGADGIAVVRIRP